MIVLKIVSKNPSLPLSVVKDYIVGHIEAEKRQTEKDLRDIETLKAQIKMIKSDNEKLSTRAKIFTNTKCHFAKWVSKVNVVKNIASTSNVRDV